MHYMNIQVIKKENYMNDNAKKTKKQGRDETINPYTNSKLVSLLQAFIYSIPEI